ncbi:aromatic amino acid transport family protein [Helicobacter turcicus]|uniref:HAAAP family serine/threonine permease n=1 Tax=Helicobacter turcicus TaxID=2867412 RepID=A0ABS7JNE7_9HELI|nr:aromatic amino acid transport family protein [Helicobacter turcicus]MBX7490934.1 HAAAP family serine/threonine permease [Helicobacter turcicus]MBX7545788.1 HAAAP family serine/threonine permease [Helicobacter turcicus]
MKSLKWTQFDTRWMLSLFGTAVGAGILYLPIKAGSGGVFPVLVMACIIFPMVFLSHKALSCFVLQASGNDRDITYAAEEYFGRKISLFIAILYFFAIFPICLAYCVGITNTFESFIYNQFLPLLNADSAFAQWLNSIYQTKVDTNGKKVITLFPFYRAILVFILVSAFMVIMLFSEEIITKVCEWLVFPLCIILFAFSLYLIPYWSFDFTAIPNTKEFLTIIWLTLPVLVFSFNHSPAISTFSLSVKKEYATIYERKTSRILFATSSMLLVFVMFFVISCVLSLSAEELVEARAQNIPILSFFANKFQNPWIVYSSPIIAFLAISSSFFGHYFGAREGAYGIVRKTCKLFGDKELNLKLIHFISGFVMYVVMLLVAFYNPSVLGFIENLGGPIIATILFIMPIVAIYTVSKLKKFQNRFLDAFVFITGLLTIITVIYTL